MALTYTDYVATGDTDPQYPITFPYLSPEDVKVLINGTATLLYTVDVDTQLVSMTTTPQNGDVVRVYRSTPGLTPEEPEMIVDFQDGSVLAEEDLDKANDQLLYCIQESNDSADSGLIVDYDGNYNASNKRIKLVGTPAADGDATTKQYVDGFGLYGPGWAASAIPQMWQLSGSDFTGTTGDVSVALLDPPPLATNVYMYIVDLDGVSQNPIVDFYVSQEGTFVLKMDENELAPDSTVIVRNFGAARSVFQAPLAADSGTESPLSVKGLPDQTADLTQWLDSDGTVLAAVSSEGDGTFKSVTADDLTVTDLVVTTINGQTPASGVPGGTAGQIIVKQSDADGDVAWEDQDTGPDEEAPVVAGATIIADSAPAVDDSVTLRTTDGFSYTYKVISSDASGTVVRFDLVGNLFPGTNSVILRQVTAGQLGIWPSVCSPASAATQWGFQTNDGSPIVDGEAVSGKGYNDTQWYFPITPNASADEAAQQAVAHLNAQTETEDLWGIYHGSGSFSIGINKPIDQLASMNPFQILYYSGGGGLNGSSIGSPTSFIQNSGDLLDSEVGSKTYAVLPASASPESFITELSDVIASSGSPFLTATPNGGSLTVTQRLAGVGGNTMIAYVGTWPSVETSMIFAGGAGTPPAESFDYHVDVDVADPVVGEVLTWDGSIWKNTSALAEAGASASVGDVLEWDGSAWVPAAEAGSMALLQTYNSAAFSGSSGSGTDMIDDSLSGWVTDSRGGFLDHVAAPTFTAPRAGVMTIHFTSSKSTADYSVKATYNGSVQTSRPYEDAPMDYTRFFEMAEGDTFKAALVRGSGGGSIYNVQAYFVFT